MSKAGVFVFTGGFLSYFPLLSSQLEMTWFSFSADINPFIGAPIFFAIRPAVRLEKLPDGTETMIEGFSILLSYPQRYRITSTAYTKKRFVPKGGRCLRCPTPESISVFAVNPCLTRLGLPYFRTLQWSLKQTDSRRFRCF